MPWESEEEKKSTGRDWAKYMWLGIVLLVVVGVAAMFVPWSGGGVDVTRARVSHILVKFETQDAAGYKGAMDKILSWRQEILNGANFASFAAAHSDDLGSRSKGGDLGWVQRGEMTEKIDDYIWSAPLNQVSEPFESGSGLHLIVIKERQISDAERYDLELKDRVMKGQSATGAATAP